MGGSRSRARAGMFGAAAAVAVAVVAVLLVARPWADGGTPPDREPTPALSVPTAPLSPDLAGRFVVVSFVVGDQEYVLDPDAGQYVAWRALFSEVSAAPHLRLVARLGIGGLELGAPADGAGQNVSLPLAGGLAGPVRVVWSPDGALAATAVYSPDPDPAFPSFSRVAKAPGGVETGVAITPLQPFRRVVVVDVAARTARVVSLRLPEGEFGAPGGSPVWLDAAHLAVPTMTVRTDGDDAVITDAVSVFDLDGALVRQVPLAGVLDLAVPDGSLVGYGWELIGVADSGEFLLLRSVDERTLQVAAVSDGGGESRIATVALPAPALGLIWVGQAATALGGSEVLVHAAQVLPAEPVEEPQRLVPEHTWLVVDLGTGEVDLSVGSSVPAGASRLGVGGAEWLAPTVASGLELFR